MPMNVTTAPTAPLTARSYAPVDAPQAVAAVSPSASPTGQLAGDEVATTAATGSLSKSALTLAAARGNTVTQGNNNITIVNNFDADVARPVLAVDLEFKPQRRENAIELIARGLGKLLNTLTFGFFGALGRGFRGETPQEA